MLEFGANGAWKAKSSIKIICARSIFSYEQSLSLTLWTSTHMCVLTVLLGPQQFPWISTVPVDMYPCGRLNGSY